MAESQMVEFANSNGRLREFKRLSLQIQTFDLANEDQRLKGKEERDETKHPDVNIKSIMNKRKKYKTRKHKTRKQKKSLIAKTQVSMENEQYPHRLEPILLMLLYRLVTTLILSCSVTLMVCCHG